MGTGEENVKKRDREDEGERKRIRKKGRGNVKEKLGEALREWELNLLLHCFGLSALY